MRAASGSLPHFPPPQSFIPGFRYGAGSTMYNIYIYTRFICITPHPPGSRGVCLASDNRTTRSLFSLCKCHFSIHRHCACIMDVFRIHWLTAWNPHVHVGVSFCVEPKGIQVSNHGFSFLSSYVSKGELQTAILVCDVFSFSSRGAFLPEAAATCTPRS